MPYIHASHYQHELDGQLLAAMKAIPEFTAISNVFMREYDERAFYLISKLTHVEMTPQQLSEYYEMLPPICEKLGIETPTVLLANNPEIKAYTTNASSPIIIVNSGVLLNCSEDTIRAMFAHECGHIANNHVFYQTLGNLIMDGSAALLSGVSTQAIIAVKAAYLRWKRASELTADRAAAIALGKPSVIANMCLELAGSWECFDSQVYTELFIQQTDEYENEIHLNGCNDAFEIILQSLKGTPSLNAFRAHEIRLWCDTDEFKGMQRFLSGEEVEAPEQGLDIEAQEEEEGPGEQEADQKPEQSSESEEVDQRDGDDESLPGGEKTVFFCSNCGAPYQGEQELCSVCGSQCD